MSATLQSSSTPRTIHLTADAPVQEAPKKQHKGLRLTDLRAGETVRISRLTLADTSCRKRFAEMGMAEGMKVTVIATGETLMLAMGTGGSSRMAVAARCAETIYVVRA
jgi:Fe2+ transport system protein FeoA